MKKIRPGQKIKLTSVEELLGVSNEESAMDIEVVKIQPFRNHPFKVIDDEKMEDLVESIRTNGILSPVLIRPIGNDIYEMVSGHRRMHAAILLGMDRIPAIIREMTDDEAIVKMVDANIQREELLPSEKAFAYKMKMDAMKNQGYRSDLTADSKTSCQFGTKSRADQQVSGQVGESARQVQRFIRLTELIPELLEYVDQKRLQFTVAVEISYIDKEVQKWLYEYIKDNGMVRLNQVVLLRAQMKTGAITQAKMISMLNNSQPGKGPATKLTFSEKKLWEFFPAHYTSTQMRDVIEDLLSDWKHKQDFEGLNGE
ncbi:MAG: ParB/RepB/Spo0J family partition protein [Lachnospiraceae bacterium]|nr:ParB/RepB/Spo0J family partition protein [Lachnospiraceae bacterium]